MDLGKIINFICENWGFFVIVPIVVWIVGYRIYTMAGLNKFWHKF